MKDNKIIFAKGYGVQSLSKKNPVDENSIYAIGSTTKAFTAADIQASSDDFTILNPDL